MSDTAVLMMAIAGLWLLTAILAFAFPCQRRRGVDRTNPIFHDED